MESLAQVDISQYFITPIGNTVGLGQLVSIILSNAMVIAGLILVFILVFGGISMIAGAGQDNPERTGKGRQAVTAAIIGFIIIFAAYWIIQVIEVLTGVQILNPGL